MSRRLSRIGDAVSNPYQVSLAAIIALCLLMALAPAVGATTADANSGPTANATASSSTVTVGETVTLDASGSTDDGSIESYEWDVDGDGETEATGATSDYSYDSPSTYNATVTVTDDSGNTDSATVTVAVEDPSNTPPRANATTRVSTFAVERTVWLDASNSTDPDGAIESYEWDIDGDGEVEATGPTPGISYDSPGTYNATVTVTDDRLATDTATVTLTVPGDEEEVLENNDVVALNPDRSAGSNGPPPTDIDGGATYHNLSISSPQDNDFYAVELNEGESVTASIEFEQADQWVTRGGFWQYEALPGDLELLITDEDEHERYGLAHAESTSETDDERASWTADSSGTYWIVVHGEVYQHGDHMYGDSVTGNYNLTISTSGSESGPPDNNAPTASATANSSSLTAGETVTFDASDSTDGDGSIESYEWDVDSDGEIEGTGAVFNHSYGTTGVNLGASTRKVATVYVTDDDGVTTSETVTVTLADWPTASATANESTVSVGETVRLNASGTFNPDGTIESYGWDLDNESYRIDSTYEATGVTTEVSFDSPGTYDAELIVTDENGWIDDTTVTITVEEASNSEPTANATANSSTTTVNETVTLDASGSTDADGSIESYEWDVDGDGETEATGATNDYSYDSAGTYNVTLTVTDDDGATDNATVTVTVEADQDQSMFDAVDADDDGTISDEEILNALDYWQDGEPAPGTGGESISDQEILDLIATWQQADSD